MNRSSLFSCPCKTSQAQRNIGCGLLEQGQRHEVRSYVSLVPQVSGFLFKYLYDADKCAQLEVHVCRSYRCGISRTGIKTSSETVNGEADASSLIRPANLHRAGRAAREPCMEGNLETF
ncbi:hypothetical protein RRG08_032520 [Elysia crispata]|uniref:Uncharacterized protein n=1 Tax=Elysia crispata TaxID=231223 RepID=A0AAE0ZZB9_9GAST|nr:hypothetical protein RRG08_032520 [Elysia crispata]